MVVVGGGGVFGGPVFEYHVSGPNSQGAVGVCNELGGSDVAPAWEGGVEDEGETG